MIGIDVHECEQLKVMINNHASSELPFATLKLRSESGDTIKLFFDELENIFTFANDIIDEIHRVEKEALVESP